MAWIKILDAADTISNEIYVTQPFVIFAEGTFDTRTITVEMQRIDTDDETEWWPVNVNGALISSDPLVALGGVADTRYRVRVSSAGLNIFINAAYPTRES